MIDYTPDEWRNIDSLGSFCYYTDEDTIEHIHDIHYSEVESRKPSKAVLSFWIPYSRFSRDFIINTATTFLPAIAKEYND